MEIKSHITAEEFFKLRESVGWKNISLNQLQKALDHSMIIVAIYEEDKVAAMGRLVGDFSLKAMLTDICVHPDFQKKGYGKLVVTTILEKALEKLAPGESLNIEASPTAGNRGFYINCGLKYKPENQDGVYIWLKK